jgi:hypothetical protein
MRVAGVAVAGRNDNGIVLSGKSLENWFGPATGGGDWPIIVQDAFRTITCGNVRPRARVDRPGPRRTGECQERAPGIARNRRRCVLPG